MKPFLALLLCAFLSGCVTNTHSTQTSAIHFPQQSAMPVAILVIDQRPPEERIKDHSNEFIYSTFNPEGQVQNLGLDIGDYTQQFGGIPTYRIIKNFSEVLPHELFFKVSLNHWFSRWPKEIGKGMSIVNVEGLCDVDLQILQENQPLYTKTYRTEGKPLVADLYGVRQQDFEKLIIQSLTMRGDDVCNHLLTDMMTDLSENWNTIITK